MTSLQGYPYISYQPLNLLFRLVYVGTIVVRLPLWLIVALLAPPSPKWSVKQTLLCRLAKAVTDLQSRIGITEKISLQPGGEGDRFQIIQPLSSDIYKGPLSSSSVSPEAVGATWFPQAPGKDIASKTVALYLHGGAFVKFDGRDKASGFAGKTLTTDNGVDTVLSLQYRLSGYAGRSPFPAAFQDSLTAYLFLLRTLGVPPRQIILCGDSSGGNLVIALLRYIHEFGAALDIPPPRCAALFSPWVSLFEYEISKNPRSNSDYLPSSFLRWGAMVYTAGLTSASSNPYITPIGHAFATSVPVFVNIGTAEVFLDIVQEWVKEMQAVEGNQVVLHLEVSGVHDTLLVATLVGFEESAIGAVTQMGEFVRKL